MSNHALKLNKKTLVNLLHYVSGKPRSKCLSDINIEISFQEYALLSRCLKLLHKQVPLAYVVGFREFFSRKFLIGELLPYGCINSIFELPRSTKTTLTPWSL